MQRSLELGVVGNCTWGGLVDERARLVWACFPRFDSDPFFPALLDEREHGAGSFAIELLDLASSEQRYEGNTPILVTTLRDRAGSEVEVRDFAPRFQQHGRFYRPTMLVRRASASCSSRAATTAASGRSGRAAATTSASWRRR